MSDFIRCGRVRVLIDVGQTYVGVEAYLDHPKGSGPEYVRVFCDGDQRRLGLVGSLARPPAYLEQHTIEAVQEYLDRLRSELTRK